MTAGVVNINAGVVNGGGGDAGTKGGILDRILGKLKDWGSTIAAAITGTIGTVVAGSVTAALGAGLATLGAGILASIGIKAASGQTDAEWTATLEASYKRLGIIGDKIDTTNSRLKSGLTGGQGPGRGGVPGPTPTDGSLTGRGGPGRGSTAPVEKKITDLQKNAVSAIDSSKEKTSEKLGVLDRSTLEAGQATSNAAKTAGVVSALGSWAGAGRVVSAIATNRPIVNTDVRVYVTASSVTSSQTTQTRTGSSGGSRSNDNYDDHR
jgi:hypothetical protein